MVDLQNTSKFRKSFAAIFGMSAENEDTGENNNSDDTQDKNKASDDGEDDTEENASNENDPGKNCSDDDDGDDESDADDEKDDEKAKARARERGRCKAILLSPAAKNDLQQAYYLAFGSNLSRRQAINILSMSTKKSPDKQGNAGKSTSNNAQRFNQRMENNQNRVTQIAPPQPKNENMNKDEKEASMMLSLINAIGKREVKGIKK